MGLNAFFAYTVCLGLGYTYQQAPVIVFLSGVLFIVISAAGIREAIVRAIPNSIKAAITPGIGLFIIILGLKNDCIVVKNDATLVGLVDFASWHNSTGDVTHIMSAVLSLIGLVIIGVLVAKKVKGAVIIGIIATPSLVSLWVLLS